MTTLFDLIATLQDHTATEEDDVVTAMVIDLCMHGHLRFAAPRGSADESQRALWS